MELKVDRSFLKIKGEPIGEVKDLKINVEAKPDKSIIVSGEFPPQAVEISKLEAPPKEDLKTEELFMDENDRVYRFNEHGDKTIVVTFDSPEFERTVKLELYMKKNFSRIQEWHKVQGRKAPPLGWDERTGKWVWMNRKMRRMV